mmetsp:Transcript_18069/g.69915  ORF Transcript_18069/g.69915 Transcript_18069/m.69915 type:complete len:429 (-) Transcript_18069:66-1352(-)|eukprot:CAMPEP_0114604558 /NCGR_PEP_ID=MMETSP0168-20121206/608_1 /TAXON_ID=95228 ORGANISM="Vannella sp., Strain DIVA3 517/6/12" /NCGR_SAMPLE_ID=MMETSP0168 /ASSEMBLY_ACC=CAM_ASM_000044 /LENGTH=428 /DNA_ID=CAMNT_0001815395 /DNA_START=18 /DNA_END=1304 /DNA_ORIENTATION=+
MYSSGVSGTWQKFVDEHKRQTIIAERDAKGEDLEDSVVFPPEMAAGNLTGSGVKVERRQAISGFPFQYKSESIEDRLLCWLCNHPATNVVQMNVDKLDVPAAGVGRLSCLSCVAVEFGMDVEELVKDNYVLPESGDVMGELDTLETYCPFKGRGCPVVTTRGSIKTHVDSCEYFAYECLHADKGCAFAAKEKEDIMEHMSDCAAGKEVVPKKYCRRCGAEEGCEEAASYHPGMWHGYSFFDVSQGSAGVLGYRAVDGVKTGIVVPLMAVGATGATIVGAGGVLGLTAALTAAVVVGVGVTVPLISAGFLLMAPVASTKYLCTTAVDGIQAFGSFCYWAASNITSDLLHVVMHPVEATCAVAQGAFNMLRWTFNLPGIAVDGLWTVATLPAHKEIMAVAPFHGLQPWTCCGELGSFAEGCSRCDKHDFI